MDKTLFLKEWWESDDSVTLITRPRRFGKTLNMSMVEEFFSVDYAGRGDLFEGLFIWEEEKYQQLTDLYAKYSFLLKGDLLYETEKEYFWSILNFFDKRQYATYWANTSSNSLVGKLIREGGSEIKQSMEQLLKGEHLFCPIDEQIVYNQLDNNEEAIWSLLVASGYLKIISYEQIQKVQRRPNYELALTNGEVRLMFEEMISGWFGRERGNYNRFIKSMLAGDVEEMNEYMNEISMEIFSTFDTGKRVSKKAQPQRFYHGFVLGLLVDLKGRYHVTSNQESGYGRYDVMLEPVNPGQDDAIIIEFKVFNPKKEKTLEETLQSALAQIEKKQYEANLIARGIPAEKIHKYGFVFEGKSVLIGEGLVDKK